MRGLAALMVVLHHLLVAFYPTVQNGNLQQSHIGNGNFEIWYCYSPMSVFTNGNFAVYIFFVLSGYVLSRKYFITNDSSVLISAAVKRYFRLFIPIFFTITVVFIFIKLHLFLNVSAGQISKSDWLQAFWLFNPDVNDLLYNGFFEVFFFKSDKFDTVLWTMSIELFGSMLVFALLALTHNLRNRWIVYLILLFMFVKLEYFFYASFIVGIVLSNYYSLLIEFGKTNASLPVKIILLLAGLLFGGYFSGQSIEGTIYEKLYLKYVFYSWDSFHFYGSAFLVTGIILSPLLHKVLSIRPVSFLGKLSFSMYLLHPVVIGSFSSWMLLQFDTIDYNSAMLLIIPVTILVVFVTSYLMAVTIDRMSLTVPGKIYEKIFCQEPFGLCPTSLF